MQANNIKPEVQAEVNHILSAKDGILSAKEGHFSKVTWAGRLVRAVKNLFSNREDAFADCRLEKVAEEVRSFLNNNKINSNDKTRIIMLVDYDIEKYNQKHPDKKLEKLSTLIFKDAQQSIKDAQQQLAGITPPTIEEAEKMKNLALNQLGKEAQAAAEKGQAKLDKLKNVGKK